MLKKERELNEYKMDAIIRLKLISLNNKVNSEEELKIFNSELGEEGQFLSSKYLQLYHNCQQGINRKARTILSSPEAVVINDYTNIDRVKKSNIFFSINHFSDLREPVVDINILVNINPPAECDLIYSERKNVRNTIPLEGIYQFVYKIRKTNLNGFVYMGFYKVILSQDLPKSCKVYKRVYYLKRL